MRLYDVVLVLKSSLSEPQRKKLLETIKSWLKDVKIVKEEGMGQKVLAYPIKHEISGFYHKLHLEAETIPSDFEKRLFAAEEVLRHLLVRKK